MSPQMSISQSHPHAKTSCCTLSASSVLTSYNSLHWNTVFLDDGIGDKSNGEKKTNPTLRSTWRWPRPKFDCRYWWHLSADNLRSQNLGICTSWRRSCAVSSITRRRKGLRYHQSLATQPAAGGTATTARRQEGRAEIGVAEINPRVRPCHR